jgi:hypothetical protein
MCVCLRACVCISVSPDVANLLALSYLVKSVLLWGCAWGNSGHVLHYACCRDKISGSWPGPAISFAFLNCPICALRMSHPALQSQLESVASLHKDLEVFLVFVGRVRICMCPTIYT